MNYVIRLRPIALSEMDEAYEWYESQSPGVGSEFILETEACFERIRQHPTAYAIVYDQVRHALLDRFPYGIWYRIEESDIIVFACFHSHRDPTHLKDRR
jgi:plasmid stabilization system protein ParE